MVSLTMHDYLKNNQKKAPELECMQNLVMEQFI